MWREMKFCGSKMWHTCPVVFFHWLRDLVGRRPPSHRLVSHDKKNMLIQVALS